LEGHAHWVNTLALSTDYVIKTAMVPQPGSNSDKSIFNCLRLNINFIIIFLMLMRVFFIDDNVLAEAKKRYDMAVANGGERLISGSDDFTLFLWAPETSKNSVGNDSCQFRFK